MRPWCLKVRCFGLQLLHYMLPLQVLTHKQVPTLETLMGSVQLADPVVLSELAAPNAKTEVNRWDLIQRGEN